MRYGRKLAGVAAASLLGVIGFTGCDSNSPDDYGTVRVRMTDAPIDEFAKANVTINRVVLVGEDEAGEEGAVGHVLYEGSFMADLLELQNGVDTLLAIDEVPVGRYSQLRLIVDEGANVEYLAGGSETLKIPSGSTSGIKIQLPGFEIAAEDDTVDVLIDFVLDRSFVKAGNSGKYIFKPVIKPVSLEINTHPVSVDTTAATVEPTS